MEGAPSLWTTSNVNATLASSHAQHPQTSRQLLRPSNVQICLSRVQSIARPEMSKKGENVTHELTEEEGDMEGDHSKHSSFGLPVLASARIRNRAKTISLSSVHFHAGSRMLIVKLVGRRRTSSLRARVKSQRNLTYLSLTPYEPAYVHSIRTVAPLPTSPIFRPCQSPSAASAPAS